MGVGNYTPSFTLQLTQGLVTQGFAIPIISTTIYFTLISHNRSKCFDLQLLQTKELILQITLLFTPDLGVNYGNYQILKNKSAPDSALRRVNHSHMTE